MGQVRSRLRFDHRPTGEALPADAVHADVVQTDAAHPAHRHLLRMRGTRRRSQPTESGCDLGPPLLTVEHRRRSCHVTSVVQWAPKTGPRTYTLTPAGTGWQSASEGGTASVHGPKLLGLQPQAN